MRFALTVSSDVPAATDPELALSDLLERARTAHRVGYDGVAVAHRYSIGPAEADARGEPLFSYRFQPLLILARLAAEFGNDFDYITSVLLSAPSHPVRLAEEITTLDTITGGRLRIGIGIGWLPYEFEAFDVALGDRAARFDELVLTLRALLSGDPVDFEGRFFRFKNVKLLAHGVQRPMPPLWLGASTDAAVRRAARSGDAWVISGHLAFDRLERQMIMFREAREAAGLPLPEVQPMVRQAYVADSHEEAWAKAMPAIDEWYRRRRAAGWSTGSADDQRIEVTDSGRWIIGSPDECIEQISRLRDSLGINHLITAMSWPNATQETKLQAIELLGTRVLPALRS